MPATLTEGHRLFARYAHAPNALGYCGPAGAASLRSAADPAASEIDGAELARLARQFSGAWPYQQLIAELAGIADPLDERVGRAYWTGNELTGALNAQEFGRRLLDRIGPQAGHYWAHLTAELLAEVAPTHLFHVFAVYPWSRLLGTGRPEPLHVLDSCRITPALVLEVAGDSVLVRRRPLGFDGNQLALAAEAEHRVSYRVDGSSFVGQPQVGEWVAVHWDFVCDRLTVEQVDRLQHWTDWQLRQTNPRLGRAAGQTGA